MRTHLNITDPQERKLVAMALLEIRFLFNNCFFAHFSYLINGGVLCVVSNNTLLKVGDIKL